METGYYIHAANVRGDGDVGRLVLGHVAPAIREFMSVRVVSLTETCVFERYVCVTCVRARSLPRSEKE